ncbi:hypothetical protein E3A20_19000 [Planctomyces bekefii]|uniref:RHS repeat-associated core domain-containing protein n=1 Tax=Planctomyces bekefii TaxID=1653850 RepID=A0A5C6M4R8_9PLAN|nr:hypothetical protein E3A20_19000 [Planctomyces bekefii]
MRSIGAQVPSISKHCCDSTGSVGERYAYSAYGAPVFMTGAGTVQTSSPIGFETLYAGYRWDNPAPQMYYVRNRFLLPLVGTWNRRDPLGYVDGMALICYVESDPVSKVDPQGTYTDKWHPTIEAPQGSGNFLWVQWKLYEGDFFEDNRCYHRSEQPEVRIGCYYDTECSDIRFIQVFSITSQGPDKERVPLDLKKAFKSERRTGQCELYKYAVSGSPGGRCQAVVDVFPYNLEGGGPWYGNRHHMRGVGPYMIDAPGGDLAVGEVFLFETCAICASGKQRGTVYGCVEWGFRYVNRKPPGKSQSRVLRSGEAKVGYCADLPTKWSNEPSEVFKKALERFRQRQNAAPGKLFPVLLE